MANFLEKIYNCYLHFLNDIGKGNVNIDYKNLYGSVILQKNNITNKRLVECMSSKLNCPIIYQISDVKMEDKILSWAMSSNTNILNSFVWNEVQIDSVGTYYITTNSQSGFNFIYISIPQGSNFSIYNSLDIEIFNSTLPQSGINQLFSLSGTITTSKGGINNVYRKDDVFNTFNPVSFKIKIF